jgi:hypothetical protein
LVWFVGVVGVGDLCGQMSRLVMILNWPLRGVIVLLSDWPLRGVIVCSDLFMMMLGKRKLEMGRLVESELAASRSNCFAELCS